LPVMRTNQITFHAEHGDNGLVIFHATIQESKLLPRSVLYERQSFDLIKLTLTEYEMYLQRVKQQNHTITNNYGHFYKFVKMFVDTLDICDLSKCSLKYNSIFKYIYK